MKFSQRIGITSLETALQVQGINDELRNSLWNVLDELIWNRDGFKGTHFEVGEIEAFSRILWFGFFNKPMDERPDQDTQILLEIRNFYFNCPWNVVYDFLKFVLQNECSEKLNAAINIVLERELSGYRFIKSKFVQVTEEIEIEAVNKALAEGPFFGVHAHLKQAIHHLANREKPDYRNSIKESISAVESMAREVTGNSKATLGEALSILEKGNHIPPALKQGFSAIYGYASDADGIRHAMLEESEITIADAKFF